MTLDTLQKLLRYQDESYLQISVYDRETTVNFWLTQEEGVDPKQIATSSGTTIADALTQMEDELAACVDERAIEAFWIGISEEEEEKNE